MGQASGIMASMTMLGSFVGFALFGFYLSVEESYLLYATATLSTVLITCFTAREKVLKTAQAAEAGEPPAQPVGEHVRAARAPCIVPAWAGSAPGSTRPPAAGRST